MEEEEEKVGLSAIRERRAEVALAQRRAAQLGPPCTVLGVLEALWGASRDEDRVVVLLPNGSKLRGRFHGTYAELCEGLDALERALGCLRPPSRAGWAVEVPPFAPPERPRTPPARRVEIEPVPPFSPPREALERLEACAESAVCGGSAPLPLVEAGLETVGGLVDQLSALPAPALDRHQPGCDTGAAQAPARAEPPMLWDLDEQELGTVADLCFGRKYAAAPLGRPVDHVAVAEACQPCIGLIDVRFEAPNLVDVEAALAAANKAAARQARLRLKESAAALRTPRVPTASGATSATVAEEHVKFPLHAEPDPTLCRRQAAEVILDAHDIKRCQNLWRARAEERLERSRSSAEMGDGATFTQHQSIPGLRRGELDCEHGEATFSKGQRFAYVQFSQPLGPEPCVDLVRLVQPWVPQQEVRLEVHDCCETGCVLFLELGAAALEDPFNPDPESCAPVAKVAWRALHTDWARYGAVARDGTRFRWQPRVCVDRGLLLPYPRRPVSVPPLWTQELRDEEVSAFVRLARLEGVERREPPAFPAAQLGALRAKQAAAASRASQRGAGGASAAPRSYTGYKATIVLEGSSDMLAHDLWQRAKFMLRAWLSPSQGYAERVFGAGGALCLVATGVVPPMAGGPWAHLTRDDRGCLLELGEPTPENLLAAQRWVASLQVGPETACGGDDAIVDVVAGACGRQSGAVHVVSARRHIGAALPQHVTGLPPLHVLFLCIHGEEAAELMRRASPLVRSVALLDFGADPAQDLQEPRLDLSEARERAEATATGDKLTEAEEALDRERERIVAAWEEEVQAHNAAHAAEVEKVRARNRPRLEQAKRKQQAREARRQAVLRDTRQLVAREQSNEAAWKWQSLAALLGKHDALTGLNIFLAVASAVRKRSARRRARERGVAVSAAVDAVVMVVEQCMVQVSRRAWLAHAEMIRKVRESNELALAQAAAERQRHAEAIAASQSDLEHSLQAVESRTAQRLSELLARDRARLEEKNERLRMAAEERHQRKLEAAAAKLENPHLRGLLSAANNKRECLRQLVHEHLGAAVASGRRLAVPHDPAAMLSAFAPLRSQQARAARWHTERAERAERAQVESRLWHVMKSEFMEALAEARAKGLAALEVPALPDPQAPDPPLSATEVARLQACDLELQRLRAELDNTTHNVETQHRNVVVRGWRLLLLAGPHAKHDLLVRLRALWRRAIDLSVALEALDRLQLEREGLAAATTATAAVDEPSRTALDELQRELSAAANIELVRTLRARAGLARTGRARPWRTFSLRDRAKARFERRLVALRYAMTVQTGHLQAALAAQTACREARKAAVQAWLRGKRDEIIEASRARWKAAVADPIEERNRSRERVAAEEQERLREEMLREHAHNVEVARATYAAEVVAPIREFNASIKPFLKRADAAREELRLLKAFRKALEEELLPWKVGPTRGAPIKREVPMRKLERALQAAFAPLAQQRPAGSGTKAAQAKRQRKPTVLAIQDTTGVTTE